jgi:predicted DsbA family dithiol-disulfide isomerase
MQEQLEAAIGQTTHNVKIVRKMMPLSIHPHAQAAALAYCCADAQGKGDEMAAQLFTAKPDDLTPEGCEKLAAGIGCDMDRYHKDMPAAETRVKTESAEVEAAGVKSLPTLYIADQRIVGASKNAQQLTDMLNHAPTR